MYNIKIITNFYSPMEGYTMKWKTMMTACLAGILAVSVLAGCGSERKMTQRNAPRCDECYLCPL